MPFHRLGKLCPEAFGTGQCPWPRFGFHFMLQTGAVVLWVLVILRVCFLSSLAAPVKDRWCALPWTTFPGGCGGIESVCVFQVAAHTLGFRSLFTRTSALASSCSWWSVLVLILSCFLGSRSTRRSGRFRMAFGRHREREPGSSVRMRRLELLLMAMEDVHSETYLPSSHRALHAREGTIPAAGEKATPSMQSVSRENSFVE